VVDMRRDVDDRLNSWALMVIDALAGMFPWMIGLFFFLLDVDIVVSGRGA
jgi:hypothetical protein